MKCTFRDFIRIIEDHGFILIRHDGSSHRRYRAVRSGRVWLVDVAMHHPGDEIAPGTLASMIRQSGLSKGLFRR
ncbi:MAG: type II toxin-antitoxin system HicA family toxin [Alphaproteobacteria bacterium]|nr:type II toxin-antitoxin system HicA family toxin [Alphaproteobacteria bacterium]